MRIKVKQGLPQDGIAGPWKLSVPFKFVSFSTMSQPPPPPRIVF